MTTQQYRELKCARCGWVHMAVPAQVARASGGDVERYLRCYRCGAPSEEFVPALADDAPTGCTLQPCVVGCDGGSLSPRQVAQLYDMYSVSDEDMLRVMREPKLKRGQCGGGGDA
jgi:DNA-directed RNA polymerase subunit RPC12/RpoP